MMNVNKLIKIKSYISVLKATKSPENIQSLLFQLDLAHCLHPVSKYFITKDKKGFEVMSIFFAQNQLPVVHAV